MQVVQRKKQDMRAHHVDSGFAGSGAVARLGDGRS